MSTSPRLRRDEIITADRLLAKAKRAVVNPRHAARVAGLLFERAAVHYQRATLGEAARLAWLEAVRCHEASKDSKRAKKCIGEAKKIPEYWALTTKEDDR